MSNVYVGLFAYGSANYRSRDLVSSLGHLEYLRHIARILVRVQEIHTVAAIAVYGGQELAGEFAEANSVGDSLRERLKEHSISALEDVEIRCHTTEFNAVQILTAYLHDIDAIKVEEPDAIPLLICDRTRYEKVCWLADEITQYFGLQLGPAAEYLYPVNRPDSHPNSTKEYQENKIAFFKKKGIEYVLREHNVLKGGE